MTVFEFVLWSPLMLAIVYPFGIKYEHPEGGKYKLLLPFYAAAAILSVTVNVTWLSLVLWELPKKREITTSQRCERLVFADGWPGVLARAVARYTNRFDPTPPHIPLP